MANQGYTVPVADPSLALRKTQVSDTTNTDSGRSAEEETEHEEIEEIMCARKEYGQDRKAIEIQWTESFKMYMSWIDKTINPFLSNLFIPKTHEAVELLAAFLIGNNQSISASPENGSADTVKSRVAAKWLDYLWRKVIRARVKILICIKQAILFGDGIMKFGWDPVEKKPWMTVCPIEDVYFEYFVPHIQDSKYIIYEVRRDPDDVKKDPKYDVVDKENKPIREQVIIGGDSFESPAKALFNTYDQSFIRAENRGNVLVMEVWCKEGGGEPQEIITLLPTKVGWRIARKAPNPNRFRTHDGKDGEQFRPFVKMRFKPAALPNRAYDMGAVYPTIHIQKSFNDLMRQYFDSVVLINNPMWKKRRGARINPMDLVRRPGGVITMGDINKDLAPDIVGDVKTSMIEMLNRLDREFQEASMVVNLLKAIPGANTATEAAQGQQNVQTLLDMINQNIVDALSEAGQMVLAISLANVDGVQSLLFYENEKEVAMLDFDPKNIDGMHDIRIVPDRTDNTTKAGQNAALVKLYPIVAQDFSLISKYPSIKEKMLKRMLENDGIGDPDFFFSEDTPLGQPTGMPPMGIRPMERLNVAINYKDAPPDIQREIETMMGFPPSQQGIDTRSGAKDTKNAPAAPPAPAAPAAMVR